MLDILLFIFIIIIYFYIHGKNGQAAQGRVEYPSLERLKGGGCDTWGHVVALAGLGEWLDL